QLLAQLALGRQHELGRARGCDQLEQLVGDVVREAAPADRPGDQRWVLRGWRQGRALSVGGLGRTILPSGRRAAPRPHPPPPPPPGRRGGGPPAGGLGACLGTPPRKEPDRRSGGVRSGAGGGGGGPAGAGATRRAPP